MELQIANNPSGMITNNDLSIFNFTGPQSSSLVEVALCYVTPKPLNCLKEQTGRMLDYWEGKVEEKRQDLMGE